MPCTFQLLIRLDESQKNIVFQIFILFCLTATSLVKSLRDPNSGQLVQFQVFYGQKPKYNNTVSLFVFIKTPLATKI